MAILSRRDILRHLAFAGLAMAIPASTLAHPTEDNVRSLGSRLSRFFTNRESAQTIGRRYLTLAPGEDNLNLLTALICRTPENHSRLAAVDIRQLRELLSVQQKQDFELGRTVSIDGWILSETEALLCAIATLA